MKKYAAFTLVELILVMLLATFVLSMGLLAHQIMDQLYRQYERETEVILELDAFRAILQTDFARSQGAIWEEGNLILEVDSVQLSYSFERDFVCRQILEIEAKVDTVFCETKALHLYWEKALREENGPVDALDWEIEDLDFVFRIRSQKNREQWESN